MRKLIFILLLFSFQLKADTIIEASPELINSKDKTILFVNIATRCGYTPQLEGLETLYQKYKDQGLKIIGIPTNDFGSQTPESNEKVASFCRLKYGVSFPITKKAKVSDPLMMAILKKAKREKIQWNFEKFLFSKDGKFEKHFESNVEPQSKKLTQSIEKLLHPQNN